MSRKWDKANGEGAVGEAAAMAAAAKGERKLLRAERRAEERLAAARARLEKAQARLRRRQAEVEEAAARVAQAEAELRERQAARAAGPGWSAVTVPTPAAASLVLADGAPATTARPAQEGGDAAAPVLLPDGSPADGAPSDHPPDILTPGQTRPASRRRKPASS